MTKEEVAQVIAYCDENKISYKQYLAELGVNPWSFYDAKRKYAPKMMARMLESSSVYTGRVIPSQAFTVPQ